MFRRGDVKLYEVFDNLGINVEYYEHPPAPTIEDAQKYWEGIDSTHCKNLFFRNHKGNRHYLVILYFEHKLAIKELEQLLKQGKISFASNQRLFKHLGVTPGSVSPFGLINDKEHHVHLFIDKRLEKAEKLSFHPNINTASLVIMFRDFIKFLNFTNNTYEFIDLY